MRKSLLVIASLLVVSAVVAAQHLNTKETPVKGDLTVASDVMLGTTLLKAGDYKVSCDRETISFSDANTGKKVFKAPCKGRELSEVSKETTIHVTADKSGTKIVDKLLLKGSNIEHVF